MRSRSIRFPGLGKLRSGPERWLFLEPFPFHRSGVGIELVRAIERNDHDRAVDLAGDEAVSGTLLIRDNTPFERDEPDMAQSAMTVGALADYAFGSIRLTDRKCLEPGRGTRRFRWRGTQR